MSLTDNTESNTNTINDSSLAAASSVASLAASTETESAQKPAATSPAIEMKVNVETTTTTTTTVAPISPRSLIKTTSDIDLTCLVCCDTIIASTPCYICISGDIAHSQCSTCFGGMIDHCCNNYSSGKFPIICPAPECSKPVPDILIRQLLNLPVNIGKLDKYHRFSLMAGLLELTNDSGDSTEITCNRCKQYSVLVPKDYRMRAIRLKQQIQSDTGDINKSSTASAAAAAAATATSAPIIPHNASTASIQPLDIDEKDSILPTATVPIALLKAVSTPGEAMLTSLFIDCQQLNCNASTCLLCGLVLDSKLTDSHECILTAVDSLYLKVCDILAESSVRRCPDCRTPGQKDTACCHITCTKCSSTRYCYHCGLSLKQLKLTSFGTHNEWTLADTTGNFCPMYLQYKYSGGTISSSRYTGDGIDNAPLLSLYRFHLILQQKALIEAQKLFTKIENKTFPEMLALKFPTGLWDQNELKALDLLADESVKNGSRSIRLNHSKVEKQLIDACKASAAIQPDDIITIKENKTKSCCIIC